MSRLSSSHNPRQTFPIPPWHPERSTRNFGNIDLLRRDTKAEEKRGTHFPIPACRSMPTLFKMSSRIDKKPQTHRAAVANGGKSAIFYRRNFRPQLTAIADSTESTFPFFSRCAGVEPKPRLLALKLRVKNVEPTSQPVIAKCPFSSSMLDRRKSEMQRRPSFFVGPKGRIEKWPEHSRPFPPAVIRAA